MIESLGWFLDDFEAPAQAWTAVHWTPQELATNAAEEGGEPPPPADCCLRTLLGVGT